MSDYLNIIANWGSNAKAGRDRARQEQNNQLKILENQYKIQETNNAIEANIESELSHNMAQAEEFSKHYRPQDKKNMEGVEREALAEIKSQLEFFGDDVMAFMRGGGRDLLNNYRDKVLGSKEANTIRANHKSIAQFLDQMKTDPQLVSQADWKGFQTWRSGNTDAFVFQGAYEPIAPASDDAIKRASGTGINARATALMETKDNWAAILHNMQIDYGQPFNPLTDEDIDSKMINYLNDVHFQGKPMTPKEEEAFTGYNANSTKMSDQLKMIGNAWDHHFVGDFSGFGQDPTDAKNYNARLNLFALSGGQNKFITNKNIPNKQSWGMHIFPGLEDRIASGIFTGQFAEGDIKKTITSKELAGLIGSGAHMVYGEDGIQMFTTGKTEGQGDYKKTLEFPLDKHDFLWGAKDWDIHSIEYGFEVIGDDGKKVLLTSDEIAKEGDSTGLLKNKSKTGVMYFVLRDAEFFGSPFMSDEKSGYGKKDQYMYVKIDMENHQNKRVINNVMGEIDYTNKKVAQTSPNEWVWQGEGETFNWTVNNQVNAVENLVFGPGSPMQSLKFMQGVPDGNSTFEATILAHALNESNIINPEEFMHQLANSQDPVIQEALNSLKDDVSVDKKANIIDYINILRAGEDANGNPYMTKGEARDLLNSYEKIIKTFWTIGQTIVPVPGETDQYQIDPFYKKF